MSLIQPVPGYAWRPPGSPFNGAHQAVDIPAPGGTPAVAVADGIVRSVGNDSVAAVAVDFSSGGGGLMVTIDHLVQGGRAAGSAISQYVHLSAIAAGLKVGQRVPAGYAIGAVGATGRATGNHLHFGFRVNGVWVDYRRYLAGGDSSSLQVVSPGTRGGGGARASGLTDVPPDYASLPPLPPGMNSLTAFPLEWAYERGYSCPAGFNVGSMVHGPLMEVPYNIWFNRARRPDGTTLACMAPELKPGDNAAALQATEVLADIARNGVLLGGLLLLLIAGIWVLVRGSGGGGG